MLKSGSTKVYFYFLLSQLILSSTSVQGNERWTDSGYILDSFIEIALNNEYSAAQTGIRKWTTAINYYFVHRVADQALHERLTKMHLAHLASITGVSFNAVNHKKKANLLIIFSTENRLEQELLNEFNIESLAQRNHLFRSSVCLAHFSIHKNGSIKKAIIIIPVDRARAHAKLISCIVEELTQAMGLPNDSEKVFPSIFNDKSHNDLLTGLDYILLKILYHPEVKTGVRVKELKEVLKKVIKLLDKQGIIAHAEQKVMEGELYSLLY